MKTFLGNSLLLVILTLAMPAWADGEDPMRTANRTVQGRIIYPARLFALPPHIDFLPRRSNADAQNQHPLSATGDTWDTQAWTGRWKGDTALQKLFQGRIFERQYMRGGTKPVVELGPVFWRLSALDQERSLKLLADQANIFDSGYKAIELADWKTRRVLGIYTAKGMALN